MAAYLAVRNRSRGQRVRQNPLQRSDFELIYEYRMSRASILELCDMLRDDLSPTTRKSAALTVEEQVLLSLKVLASGSFQSSAKDNINVSQPTVSVVLAQFMESLIRKKKNFISMPDSRVASRIKEKFYLLGHFPGVIGAIDGTHVPIIAPAEDEHLYVNRKGFHSLNVQVRYVCKLINCLV